MMLSLQYVAIAKMPTHSQVIQQYLQEQAYSIILQMYTVTRL